MATATDAHTRSTGRGRFARARYDCRRSNDRWVIGSGKTSKNRDVKRDECFTSQYTVFEIRAAQNSFAAGSGNYAAAAAADFSVVPHARHGARTRGLWRARTHDGRPSTAADSICFCGSCFGVINSAAAAAAAAAHARRDDVRAGAPPPAHNTVASPRRPRVTAPYRCAAGTARACAPVAAAAVVAVVAYGP